jgi:Ca-activated chloride channel family protein
VIGDLHSHTPQLSWGCLLFTALLLFLNPGGGLQSQPALLSLPATAQSKISVDVELVTLPVEVTDSTGSFVSGLSAQNFSVYEDGRLQKITLFQHGDSPISVGLIVDHSRSMRSKLQGVVAAITSFAESSNPQDEMFVVDFNENVSLQLPGGKPFTSSPKDIERAITVVPATGQTALYDAVIEGLEHLQLGHWNRKALIVVSDGGDNASHYKQPQVLSLVEQSQAIIYSIGLLSEMGEEENPAVLKRLCNDSGGVAYFPRSVTDVMGISAQIARDLREQYTLGFAPENTRSAHSFRRIEVKVAAAGHGKLHARTRRGYFPAEEHPDPAQHGGSGR